MYERKTVDVWVVQGDYGQGWEDLTESYDRNEAKTDAKKYRENDSAPIRVIKRRERKPEKKEKVIKDAEYFVGCVLKSLEEKGKSIYDAEFCYDEMKIVCTVGNSGKVEKYDYEEVGIVTKSILTAWHVASAKDEFIVEGLKLKGREEEGYIQAYAGRVLDLFVSALNRILGKDNVSPLSEREQLLIMQDRTQEKMNALIEKGGGSVADEDFVEYERLMGELSDIDRKIADCSVNF